MTTTNNAFAVISVSSIGFGSYRGYARTLEAAKASATMMTVRPGCVLVVRSERTGTEYALIGGRWVRNPSTVDIVAATRSIDAGYARQLFPSLATKACDEGRTWTCAYLTSDGSVRAHAWRE